MNYKEFNNYTSGSSENEIQEVQELDPNNTNINNTKNINTNILSYPLTEGEEPDMTGADNWTHKKGLVQLCLKQIGWDAIRKKI